MPFDQDGTLVGRGAISQQRVRRAESEMKFLFSFFFFFLFTYKRQTLSIVEGALPYPHRPRIFLGDYRSSFSVFCFPRGFSFKLF